MARRTIEVSFSPHIYHLFKHTEHIVVVIDVLRATSSICVAFHNGVDHIVPVASVEDSLAYREQGYIVAAERNGEMMNGFDMGNSPFSFMEERVKGARIALSTTNGTQAINSAKSVAKKLVIGSFLNLDVLCEWLEAQNENIICLCAGWKDRFNLEDTLLAGAIVDKLKYSHRFSVDCDSAIAANHLYQVAGGEYFGFLENSSHRRRLHRLNIEKDIEYCLTPNQCPVIPILAGDKLVALTEKQLA